jgi:hypothetical protein
LDSEDTNIVVLGSLGRGELTPGSDIDWYLLVDGISDPNHHALFLDADKKIKAFWPKEVGREKTFGTFVSSHDLIHKIGGEEDTNSNLTRRLLLLLESTPVGGPIVQERVVSNVLKRYPIEDQSFLRKGGHHIPHFLLNDIARFWRTMAVDFAYKLRTRSGEGWAIRNIKLRMSRKLLYVAGLLACFRCHLDFDDDMFGNEGAWLGIVDLVDLIFYDTPLDIVATFALKHRHLDVVSAKLFGAYDEFVGMLLNQGQREHLSKLPEGSGESDPGYQRAREVSHQFRDAALELFFDDKAGLGPLTRLYGVF